MYSSRINCLFFLLFVHVFRVFSANDSTELIAITPADTIIAESKHSPPLATVLSAIAPGAGQVYNGKYWKVPIIYAGFASFGYFAYYNGSYYTTYRKKIDEYNHRDSIDQKGTVTINGDKIPVDNVRAVRDSYRRYRDLNLLMMTGWYVLNIIDANVDAHFFDYDIGDDLTFHWQPVILPRQNQTSYIGANFVIRF